MDNKKALHIAHFRVDITSQTLYKSSLSEFIIKVIYVLDDNLSFQELKNELENLFETQISKEELQETLSLLFEEKKLGFENDKYSIPKTKKDFLDKEFQNTELIKENIITRYFNNAQSPKEIIIDWFETVTIEFFKEYSYEWISDLAYKTKTLKGNRERINRIINETTDKNSRLLEKDKSWLKSQYLVFITSQDKEVDQLLWMYGMTSFSASLITANRAINPITVESFKDSKCVIDTNILIDLPLEGSEYAETFKNLEAVFQKLNIEPIYFHITKEEFERVIEHLTKEVVRVVQNFSPEIIEELDDKFINSAILRQCEEIEDYELFCEEILYITEFFHEKLSLHKLDYKELSDEIDKGISSSELKTKINDIFKSNTQKERRQNALNHDAGLIAGSEFLRKNEKVFILSKDFVVCEYAKKNLIRDEIPIAIHLETLIKILAVNNGGAEIDPSNFAPLFANMIKLSLLPEKNSFKIEDLARMLDVHEQIAQLPKDDVISIANELNRNVSTGVSDDQIVLQLTRRFQTSKLKLNDDLQQEKLEKLAQEKAKEKYKSEKNTLYSTLKRRYTAELRDKYDKKILIGKIVWFLILPLVIVLFTFMYLQDFDFSEIKWENHIYAFIINALFWLITSPLVVYKKIIPKYSERISKIEEEAEELIRQDMQE